MRKIKLFILLVVSVLWGAVWLKLLILQLPITKKL